MRSLHAAGADVIALPGVTDFARHCRWYKAGPTFLRGTSPRRISALDQLPEGTVLLPCSDAWALALAALPDDFKARCPVAAGSAAALEALIDKAQFSTALARLGIPHPRTYPKIRVDSLEAIPDDVLAVSFLKPAHSQEFLARFGVKAFHVRGRAEAAARLAQCVNAHQPTPMMLQEFIPGPATHHYYVEGFIDRDGVTRARFARQRLRMYPLDFGNSTFMVSIAFAEVEDGMRALDRLFADIGYRGIFSAEFKRDERDGTLKLIEVNARPWWYVGFTSRCGVNVCALAVLDALDREVPAITEYTIGRRCVYPSFDVDAAYAEWRAGRLSLWGWARAWIGAYQPVFRWIDPWPAIVQFFQTIGRQFR